MPFAVLQIRLAKLAGEQLAPMLELKRELMYTVGTLKQGHDYSGILAENLSEERAKKLAASLLAVGVETEIRDMATLVPNPRALQIRDADCTAAGFVMQDLYGRERVHPWESVLLLSVGSVDVERTITKETGGKSSGGQKLLGVGILLTTGVPVKGLLKGKKVVTTTSVKTESHSVLDIYTLSDTPHYRIASDQFNYNYLGERRRESSWENFELLLEDLAKFATGAKRNETFNAIVSHAPTKELPDYPNLRAFDEENRWWLQFLKR